MNKFFSLILSLLFLTSAANALDMRFIQVDGVMYNSENEKNLTNIIEKINKEKNVDFVVFSGNNLSKPKKDYLESFVNIAKDLNTPFYFIVGNKDVNKQKNLSKFEYFEFLRKNAKSHKKIKNSNYVFEKNKIIFIVLDGAKEVIPSSSGYYKTETLNWLEKQLMKYENKNVIILQHFPIVPPTENEIYYTYKSEDYLQLLLNYDNVKAVVSGHFNANNEKLVNGILHISTANAPMYRIIDILDYETENPTIWTTIKE